MAEAWRAPLTVRVSAGLHGTALALMAVHPAWWPEAIAALASNHAVLAGLVLSPHSQFLGRSLHRLPSGAAGHAIALTFDDGPDPAVTPAVLDRLAQSGARATFFCIGNRARRHPALVRRILAEGHGVGNHTFKHPKHFACLGAAGVRREVIAAQAALADITGQAPGWFRAPMGMRSPFVDPVLCETGLHHAGWTRRGYDTACGDPARVLRRVSHQMQPGDVLLLHDGNAAPAPDGRAVVLHVLPPLLALLAARGLSAVPLPAATAAAAAAAETRPPAAHAWRSAAGCPGHSGNA